MTRKSFIQSLIASIALAMLPFLRRLEVVAPECPVQEVVVSIALKDEATGEITAREYRFNWTPCGTWGALTCPPE